MGIILDILDFAVAIVLYFLVFLPKWRKSSKNTLFLNTLMYIYLVFVVYFTLMPVLSSLPSIFSHGYRAMDLDPFDDLLYNRRDAMREILLNVIMMIPFGILFPLVSRSKSHLFLKTILYTFMLSLAIELSQPLITFSRSADITDLITNTVGGIIGYTCYVIFRPLLYKIKLIEE